MTERETNTILLAKEVMGWSVVRWEDWNRWEHESRKRAKDFTNVAVLMDSKVYPADAIGNAATGWVPYESIADAWMLIEKFRETPTLSANIPWARFISKLEEQAAAGSWNPLAWLLAHEKPCKVICDGILNAITTKKPAPLSLIVTKPEAGK